MAYQPKGLLPDQQALFNPGNGLFAPPPSAALPGQPAARMAGNMIQAAAQAPAKTGVSGAVGPAARAYPKQTPLDETFSDGQRSLMAGGIAAMDTAAHGTLGASLGAGLAAGTAAFVARKDARKDAQIRLEAQAQYEAMVDSLPIDPQAKVGLKQMGPAEGGKLLAEAGLKPPENQVVSEGAAQVGPDGKVKYLNPKVERPAGDRDAPTRAAMQFNDLDPNMSVADFKALPTTVKAKVEQLATRYRRDGSVNVSNNTTLPSGGGNFWQGLNGAAATQAIATMDAGRDAVAVIDILDQAMQTASLPYYGGSAANLRQSVGKFASMIGFTGDLTNAKVTTTDELKQQIQAMTLVRIKELGARPTDTDLRFLQEAVGSLDTDPKALSRIFARTKEILNRKVVAADEVYDRLEAAAAKDNAYLPPGIQRIRPREESTRTVTLPGGRKVTLVQDNGEWGQMVGGQFYPYTGKF